MSQILRQQARAIWQAAVEAVRPGPLLESVLHDPSLYAELQSARRIFVLGAGKAGSAMSRAVEASLPEFLPKIEGLVNVPAQAVEPLQKIRLHPGRPAGSNHPTAQGVAGAQEILRLARSAGPDDVALCLISGGGSALLPAPAEALTLEDKQLVTQKLHASGATINQMNCVRKHLSAIKGGRLAQAFRGRTLHSLIISDVIGDPLDVIASGPTAADPTTFAQALAVLDLFHLRGQVPDRVVDFLERGQRGDVPETLKELPANIRNRVVGNNTRALAAAEAEAKKLGFHVLHLGAFLEGETKEAAIVLTGILRSILVDHVPAGPPVCILSGGETTVTLSPRPGKGGRNQEFVLAGLLKLGPIPGVVLLSGGTDGEDGPTDAAGACADADTLARARQLGLDGADFLRRNDAYTFFDATGDLLRTGLTETNVMDVRVLLAG